MKNLFRITIFATLAACSASVGKCDARVPAILSSHMVLQRDRPIHIWGWADPAEKVSIRMHGLSGTATADGLGKWSVYLPPQPAGGPYQLTVAANNNIALDDIMIGDVWFASGQSNMEMPLKGFDGAPLKNGAEEIRNANHPEMRLLLVRHKASDYPLRENDSKWMVCSPETAANFSAIAYFFGRELNQREHIPIGLIDSTWGGTVVEAWMSLEGISQDASLMPLFATRAQMTDTIADMAAIIAEERREDAAAKKAGQPPPHHAWHPDPASWGPAALYNGMVAPELEYPIKGVIWYQGESNAKLSYAPLYVREFPALIADWRTHWHEGDFPFLFVQIANFTSNATENWAIVREAQRRTLSVSNTAMVVTTDIGDPDNVHPADKQTVGQRLALAARALAYREPVEYSGPIFRQAATDGDGMRVWFDHAAGGLASKGGDVSGFEIAGEDRHFVPATARIDNRSVLVTSSQVSAPKYVRYGWSNAPVLNLYNSVGLPASPFTSEETIPAP